MNVIVVKHKNCTNNSGNRQFKNRFYSLCAQLEKVENLNLKIVPVGIKFIPWKMYQMHSKKPIKDTGKNP